MKNDNNKVTCKKNTQILKENGKRKRGVGERGGERRLMGARGKRRDDNKNPIALYDMAMFAALLWYLSIFCSGSSSNIQHRILPPISVPLHFATIQRKQCCLFLTSSFFSFFSTHNVLRVNVRII